MASKRHQKASDLFRAACEMAPDARAAFLEEACAGDTKLRAEVEALLAQHEQHPSFLQQPAWHEDQGKSDQETEAVRADRSLPGSAKRLHKVKGAVTGHPDRVGPYKILQELGEGGMGIVYLAEQTEPIRRRVALKLIKLGMDTKQVIARFETERQALALMNHPNVAKVLDAGATESGRPYFVMEYVKGESITAYCDRHRLTTKERLELFMQVCLAVQHAHQKGIIHRDIKPSNVLVGVEGDKPVPKVIDFGVAKATEQKLTERTLFTEQGQLIGTPEYMSPEQAEMTVLDIDTRTDIYSLGVLLYELLVGALPFDPTSLRQAAFAEIQRIIREVEPPKPSTRLSSLGDESTTAAQKRHTDRTSLERQLRGDLDWITMKALEKDRTRRYETANSLGLDVQRHLNNEPVLASPPSAAYRARKFIRRNKGPVSAAAVIAIVLLAATSISVTLALSEAEQHRIAKQATQEAQSNLALAEQREAEANKAREAEKTAKEEADLARAAEEAQRRLAEQREAEAKQAREAERQLKRTRVIIDFLNNDLLAAVAPEKQGKDVLMRDVLDTASKALEGKFDDAPLIEASIRTTLGTTYHKLGYYRKALPHLVRALEIRRAQLGVEHENTVASMTNLAILYKDQGRFDEAEPLFIKTLELQRRVLGEEHPSTIISMGNLATLYKEQGRYDEAEPLYVKTLEVWRRVLGEEYRQAGSGTAFGRQIVPGPLGGRMSFTQPSETQTSIERLAEFYESWHAAKPGQGYDAKAAEWRAKLPPDDEATEPTP
ncbi:MAG: tetratricopeptide repeat protein [Planctomycetes bacterium]|nr:tetratricopeptide repeat protein [Planctomycetota bacterium]